MSRSFRHRRITGIAGYSEKEDKRIANRSMRRTTRAGIPGEAESNQDSRHIPISIRQVSNVYNFSKDGKRPVWHEWEMRK